MGIKINEVIEDDLKHCSLNGVNYSEYIKENYIPKSDIQKALKEGSKDISENVLAIIREEYISKADYENRLKADMVVMLEEVYATINRLYTVCHASNNHDELIRRNHALDIIQEKINTLGGNENA